MKQRFYSLDIFRGATVTLMILVNNPGSWSHIFPPLEHAPWNGCTPTDVVFPFFLFAVGNAMAFVMPGLEQAGTRSFLKKVFKRSFLIFSIGLFLNWSPFVRWQDGHLLFKSWDSVRIPGVLQRIAVCYLMGSLIVYFFKIKGAYIAAAILLMGYWILCLALGTGPDPYSLQGFWGTSVDKLILGENHMYKGEGTAFDPEGLVSTLSATVNVIFGYITGIYIHKKGKTFDMVNTLFVAGTLLIFMGFCWDMIFPINKKIWSSSFVLYTTGLAINILAVLIHLIEFRQHRGFYTSFFDVFGKNALFIFILSGLLPRVLSLIRIADHLDVNGNKVFLSPFGWFYEYCCKPVSSNMNIGSLFYALCMIVFYWLIVYWMNKKKIYLRV